MLFPAQQAVRQVDVPAALVSQGRRSRRFVHSVRKIATLRHTGLVAAPRVTDERGAPVSGEPGQVLVARIEGAVRELWRGRAAHAQRTLSEIEASGKSDVEQVDGLLESIYRAHASGTKGTDVLDDFLDTFETWQNPAGVPKVDLLFDRVDLDRAPESLGILLLATTRLTRASFARREGFFARLRGWLVGRGGRTEAHVDSMLRGLRE